MRKLLLASWLFVAVAPLRVTVVDARPAHVRSGDELRVRPPHCLWPLFGFLSPRGGGYTVDWILVAGGGSGGTNTLGSGVVYSGGGGAGDFLAGSTFIFPGASYAILIGAGGASSGANGGNSTATGITGLTAIGGGKGGAYALNGSSGGSGGGGGGEITTGGGVTGVGHVGGAGTSGNVPGTGGGAGTAGGTGSGTAGTGTASSISGASVTYSKGGPVQADAQPTEPGSGGRGGSGDSGGPNAGVDGQLIIRYAGNQRAAGGSVATSGGYTRHTFSAGSSTFTA